jgi:hypothetical protein
MTGRTTRAIAVGFAFAASTLAAPAWAQSREDAAAYCQYVTGVADSDRALDMSPTLFGTGGVVSGQDVSPGGSLLGPTTRVIAGASYSLAGLYRGIQMRSVAEAECARYRAVSELHAFLESNKEGLTGPSLEAKLRVLEEAIPAAEQMMASARTALAQSHATVEQVNALAVRVDGLRAMAAQTRADRDALARAPQPPARPIEDVMREHGDAEAEVERREARVRASRAWDVSVRGGYDRTFGTSASYTPVFALVTITANVGGLLQPAAEARAVPGRAEWARRQVEGADDRVEQALARLRALRDADRRRLDDTRLLLTDLEERRNTLLSVPGERVAEIAQSLWFDLVHVRAEHAYVAAHLADLDRILGRDGRQP